MSWVKIGEGEMVTDFNVIVNMENPNSIAPSFWNSFLQKSPDVQFLINYNDYMKNDFLI